MERAVLSDLIAQIPAADPVLIAGPTASGKSALALAIARMQGGTVVNADAAQVYDCWRVLTARPSRADEAVAPHALYGHVPHDAAYSVGHWLRDLAPLLGSVRPIVVGGTGLYLSALTEGLAEIPPVPAAIAAQGADLPLAALLADVAPETRARLDPGNRARVQRAWEVEHATGTPLHVWQAGTGAPLLSGGTRLVLDAPKDWLTPRIERRFWAMLDGGALEEARAMAPRFDPARSACRVIGAAELLALLTGQLTKNEAAARATIRTRQYAKRQRTWFRKRMAAWTRISAPALA